MRLTYKEIVLLQVVWKYTFLLLSHLNHTQTSD